MPEKQSEPPIKVTAEERRHPAIRAIARACIALARWQRDNNEGVTASSPKPDKQQPATSDDQPKEAGDA